MHYSSAHSGETVSTEPPRRTSFGDLFTIEQAAEYLRCSQTTVRNRARDGSLKAVRVGPRMIRIHKDDLDAILRPYDGGQAGQWAHLR